MDFIASSDSSVVEGVSRVSLDTTPVNVPPEMVEHRQNIFSDDASKQLRATQQFRRFLSIEKNPPIQKVIDCGVVPRLVQFLEASDTPALQYEALWALTNIVSSDKVDAKIVVDLGALPLFIKLVQSPVIDFGEQAAMALGNVAASGVENRDLAHSLGAVSALVEFSQTLNETTRPSARQQVAFALSSLCRLKPSVPLELMRPALPLLAQLLQSQDAECNIDAAWALSFIADGSRGCVQPVLDTGVAPRLIELLSRGTAVLIVPALRALSALLSGDGDQVQVLLNHGVLPALLLMLNHVKAALRKEACVAVSRITACSATHIQSVIDANIFPKLIELLQNADFPIRKEASWAVNNATVDATPQQMDYLVSIGVLTPLCGLLQIQDDTILLATLCSVEGILKSAETTHTLESVLQIVRENAGDQWIEGMLNHPNATVYFKAERLCQTYFGMASVAGEACEEK